DRISQGHVVKALDHMDLQAQRWPAVELVWAGIAAANGDLQRARLVCRGNAEHSFIPVTAFGPEENAVVHLHPYPDPITPSARDLTTAESLAAIPIAFGIVDHRFSEVYWVTEPKPRTVVTVRSKTLKVGPVRFVAIW